MSENSGEHKKWNFLSTDLKRALDQWDDFAEKTLNEPLLLTPEEQKLKDMQKLIIELKSKLKEFE